MHDLIGDIHGHADALRRLLAKLGYAKQKGAYRHPERQAIFLGDFIDRGPQIRETLDSSPLMAESDESRVAAPLTSLTCSCRVTHRLGMTATLALGFDGD